MFKNTNSFVLPRFKFGRIVSLFALVGALALPSFADSGTEDARVTAFLDEAFSILKAEQDLHDRGIFNLPDKDGSPGYYSNEEFIAVRDRAFKLANELDHGAFALTPKPGTDRYQYALDKEKFMALLRASDRIFALTTEIAVGPNREKTKHFGEKVCESFIRQFWIPYFSNLNAKLAKERGQTFRWSKESITELDIEQASKEVPHLWDSEKIRDLFSKIYTATTAREIPYISSLQANFYFYFMTHELLSRGKPISMDELSNLVRLDKERGFGHGSLYVATLFHGGLLPITAGELLEKFGYAEAILNGENFYVDSYLELLKAGLKEKPELIHDGRLRRAIKRCVTKGAAYPDSAWSVFLGEMAGTLPAKSITSVLKSINDQGVRPPQKPGAEKFKSGLKENSDDPTQTYWRLFYLRSLKETIKAKMPKPRAY